MNRAKTTMIRSATQQQQQCSCGQSMFKIAADILNRRLSKLIHHHVWFFARFSQNEKKLVFFMYSFPTGWLDSKKTTFGAKYQQQRQLIKAAELMSCSERLNNFQSSDQKSRIWINDQFSERARRSISGTPNALMNNPPRTPMPVAMAMEFVCRPTDQRLALINHPSCAAERRMPVTAEKELMKNKRKERMMADNFVIFKFHRPQNFAGRKIN